MTTIRFQFTGEPEEAAVYELLIDAFEAEHANVRVQAEAIGGKADHLAKLVTSFAGDEALTSSSSTIREYSQFVRGAMEPIGPQLDDFEVDLGDYYDQPIEAFTFDGELQSACRRTCHHSSFTGIGSCSSVPAWRRPGVDVGGVPPGTLALTGNGHHGLGLEPSLIRLAPFVWGAGGELTDDPESPARFTLDTPAAREAMTFLVELVREDGVVPDETDLAAQDLESRFTSGKLGMLLSSRREVRHSARWRVWTGTWRRCPSAAKRPRSSTPTASVSPGRGDHLDEATQFIAFAGGPTGQGILALGGRTVPSLRSVATGAFLDPAQAPNTTRCSSMGSPSCVGRPCCRRGRRSKTSLPRS